MRLAHLNFEYYDCEKNGVNDNIKEARQEVGILWVVSQNRRNKNLENLTRLANYYTIYVKLKP